MSKIIIVLFLSLSFLKVNGQNTLVDSADQKKNVRFKYRSLIFPTVLIGYGVVGLTSPALKKINNSIRDELSAQHFRKVKLDNFTQYTPSLSVYALNAFGIHGKNNLKDRTIVMATAYIIMGSSISIIKKTSNIERPDSSNTRSFPSGHTANAFLGAEFLYQEYKDISVWYGIMGYLVATGTGFLRMTNDKHWLTDVATGAGIGILSTKIAYWVHPFLKKTIFKDKDDLNGMIMPFYNGREYGLGLSMIF
ncbi:phosphatase PAP2 family protein [Chitinophaga filiformis]|uniref:Phosphatase PAP2 family protein n=1 Tax=Chitinophaga filiformis TaxID=104663 RepID=A0ABY4I8G7_CHIFI|nr:phosphatase PAP2 family protein [Chitinophaga filiformis]UPK71664.1 phosphatase PAP2 family protein [Chitinophaga filiformis]